MAQGIESLQAPEQGNPAAQYPQEAVQQLGEAFKNLSEEEISSLRELADDLDEMSEEELTALKQVVDFLNRRSDQYDAAVQAVIRQNLVEPGDLPPDYDPVFFNILSSMIDNAMSGERPKKFARGGIASLASAGRYGDTMVAHLSPKSARMLKEAGGSGTINPATGLREYSFFSKIGDFFKKAAGIVLPIALSIPFGPIIGGAAGSGIAALINGASPTQALTAGLVGGAGGALFSGVSSVLQGGSFMQGVTGALPTGLQSMLSPTVSPTASLNDAAYNASTAGAGSYSGPKGVSGAAGTSAPSMFQSAKDWISANPMLAIGGAGLAGLAVASYMTPEEEQEAIKERYVKGKRFAPGTFKVYEAPKVNVVPTYSPAYAMGGEIDARVGGHMRGPGTGTSDDIPAKLSDGEFVMTAAAVRGAGDGDRMKGAKRMYDMMHKFEKRA